MKKFLLIPLLLIAGAVSASAHCGTCGTGEAHDKAAVKKACPSDCAKPCCAKKDSAKCDKADAKCDKDSAKCDKDSAKCDKADSAKCDKADAKCDKKAAPAAPKLACCAAGK